MAQFGAPLPGFADQNDNPQAVDPETTPGKKREEPDPPNTGGGSDSEAVRLARRGGSVAPPITDPNEKRGWVPAPSEQDPLQRARQKTEQKPLQNPALSGDAESDLEIRTAGRKARDQGKPISDCPHPANTKAQYQWQSGWMQPRPTDDEDAS